MNKRDKFDIAVFSGDGIGPEITKPCLDLLRRVESKIGGFELNYIDAPAGAQLYKDTGKAFPQNSIDVAKSADAILLSAMGHPDIRYPDGTEISPQLDLRVMFDLYAGVRPVRPIKGLLHLMPLADPRAADIDMILIRESTEGLFSSVGKGTIENDEIAKETMVITRGVSERLFDFAFNLAKSRKARGYDGRVTCVDKANVFQAFAFFRKIFDERSEQFPEVNKDYSYIDAMALNMVRQPWIFDVAVTENMFGDILSDLGAALIGGMGMAPSADIGDHHAVFQPCHGSAPDIVGKGLANPTAMFLSAAMMLDWLGEKHDNEGCTKAGHIIVTTMDKVFESGNLIPIELGGDAGTKQITEAAYAIVEEIGN